MTNSEALKNLLINLVSVLEPTGVLTIKTMTSPLPPIVSGLQRLVDKMKTEESAPAKTTVRLFEGELVQFREELQYTETERVTRPPRGVGWHLEHVYGDSGWCVWSRPIVTGRDALLREVIDTMALADSDGKLPRPDGAVAQRASLLYSAAVALLAVEQHDATKAILAEDAETERLARQAYEMSIRDIEFTDAAPKWDEVRNQDRGKQLMLAVRLARTAPGQT